MFFYNKFTSVLLCIVINSCIFIDSKVDIPEVPSDVVAVSSFIKEFHKRLEDDSYPAVKGDGNDKDFPTILDNVSFIAIRTEFSDRNVSTLVKCSNTHVDSSSVEIVNAARLSTLLAVDANVTSRLMEGLCLTLLFYSPNCPFSCLAAPHYNALPGAFPALKVLAINAIDHQVFNTQFGVAGVPTLMLFHNGKAAAKFNESEHTLEKFVKFISRVTGLKAEDKMYVRSVDLGGPVPTVLIRETDYVLGLAWAVIILALCYGLTRLQRWQLFLQSLAAVWQEANHDHTD